MLGSGVCGHFGFAKKDWHDGRIIEMFPDARLNEDVET